MTLAQEFDQGASLVFGGSGGIGAAIATRIAQGGSDVAITYRSNRERAEAAAATIAELGVACTIHQVDIADKAQIVQAITEAAQRHKRLHSVVVAAGSDIKQPFLADVTDAQWEEVIAGDLNGFFRIVKNIIPHFRAHGGGSLVHISSAGLGRTPPRDVLSVAPKAANEALVQYLAKEEGVHGIRANSVAVGVIETGIFKRLEAEGVFDAAWKEAVLSTLPLKHFGQPEDIAEAAAFFASNRSKYVTGQLLFVDGGYAV
ncbi:MAG: oxidoreductase [Pseudomonadales bacterium]|jgi:3-oxoacyl-[acyl-carrier protein] reductase|uniref:SDR family NAD(P)-dependent oxidoreductase n=1 Tax=unclassified Ketobacter TaxID=2639109 RepID=UPI000C9172A7|nr:MULTISPECIES: SDR family oxidoreductase [unclassified Ketobacter]MAQ27343.1 oxidoreductase [Pseudomonadales bacterium]MEC8811756.1 SDR family oxidoreductase [Pseudomonadota bacterium]HAU14560.1 oxidoreductase [Gammaproteobacteria bacterium]MCK5792863.1 SDR family oxidoreductase [Ketobacter sp.]RLT88152.1 MAG: SDR family oxidoreductase [Ketobacter sp. GenoA1]|tara:strand:- start:89127 stop:89903 length:777 start_codon:yes stop_codon:yes gene_type:complete